MRHSDETLRFGARAAQALLGVDRLFREESGDPDGLVVVNLDRDGCYPPADFSSYQAARVESEHLAREAERLPEPDRRVYYSDLCASTLAFIEWRERGLPFEQQLARFLHVPAEPVSEATLDTLRSELDRLLGDAGYTGDLPKRCAAWEHDNRVAAPEVPGTLERLLGEAWDWTESVLGPIPAPKSDGMRVRSVSRVAFNARCDYLERTIDLNVDPILTTPGLKHLAAHEGYPGHYLQFKRRETMHRDGLTPADALLSVVNTASSSVFEGIADAGMAMVDWCASHNDRIQSLVNRYRAAIGTQAAWRLHALGWRAGQVADWLRTVTLLGGDGWVTNRMAFIAAPARAVLIWSYWWGEPLVRAAWQAVAPTMRRRFVDFLYGRMHSNRSVNMFGSAA